MAQKIPWLKWFQDLLDERGWRSEAELTRLPKFLHFWTLLIKSFIRNRCPIRASALSYTTLLALIPMLAVVVGITSAFLKEEGTERIDQFIVKFVENVIPPGAPDTNAPTAPSDLSMEEYDDSFPTNASAATNLLAGNSSTNRSALRSLSKDANVVAVRRDAAGKINEFIQNTRSGTLGVTGSVLLIFVAISMLSRIESTFNDIWGVARGRTWGTRIILYWGVISLVPFLLVAAFGLASGPHLDWTKRMLATMPPLVNRALFQILPVIVLCVTFSIFYVLMPNTKVHWRAAAVGGAVAGVLWHLNNLASVLFVSRVVTYSKMYGTVAAVPIFMVGLYLSWLILLFGAQFAYAFQNRATYLQEKLAENVNQRGREFVALRLMTFIGQKFHRGEPPPDVLRMAEELGIPTKLIQQVMQTMVSARLAMQVAGAEAAYVPARPIENITAHDILQAMRASHGQVLATREEPMRKEVYGEFARIEEAEKQAAASITMLTLVSRATQPQLEFSAMKADAGETKLKPAVDASDELRDEIEAEPVADSPAVHSSDYAPEKSQGNETQTPAEQNETAPSFESEKKIEVAQATVKPPGDEERDFPL